jgi:hypothetical protein
MNFVDKQNGKGAYMRHLLNKCICIWLLILLFLIPAACRQSSGEGLEISGTISFENGETLEFIDITSMIFAMQDGAEPSPKHVTEWTKHYGGISMSTSIPLAWIKSMEVKKYRTEELYRCLFDPQVTITTVNNVSFQSEYKSLEWIRAKVYDENRDIKEKYVYFSGDGDFIIRKIEFNNHKSTDE